MHQGAGGISRATARSAINGCAAPAPVPTDDTADLGANSFATRGLNLREDTGMVFVPNVNNGTVLTVTGRSVVPSGQNMLGDIGSGFDIATPFPGDTYDVFLQGSCGVRVFVGTVTLI